ncbi:Eco29kI family restriction endonuclease [Comamonas sp. CMM01]|uniref:Eco29kI family restriction endonuclease n=1 Tax=Comamonas sp. CMM01 TaxID=2769280 RepID=UPI00177DE2D1|nr:Eco29kI family restriction endonuclease [Comamonas sp. CMM01]MBD9530630.1 Eco29kI family restriction endonuclease [Comamonas sp. CMM01]
MTSAEIIPFNPLDKKNLGASVAEALVSQPVHALGKLQDFSGSGIYAIYYVGPYKAYQRISKPNAHDVADPVIPIYVGKAVPQGARKGKTLPDPTKSKSLFKRLQEHAESISLAESLDISDFVCRYLVVDEIWIPLGESLMIAKFSPLWNLIVEGFGNHDPGSGRYNGLRPRWDTMHPGRGWALKCKERPETAADIEKEVMSYLDSTALPATPHFVGRNDL